MTMLSDMCCLLAIVALAVAFAGPSVWRDWKEGKARETGPLSYPEVDSK